MDQFHPVTIAIGAGNLALLILVASLVWRGERRLVEMTRAMSLFLVEHNMLLVDYVERKQIRLEDLPTRMRGNFGK